MKEIKIQTFIGHGWVDCEHTGWEDVINSGWVFQGLNNKDDVIMLRGGYINLFRQVKV